MTNLPASAELTAEFWAKAADPGFRERHRLTNWMGHLEVQRHINQACSGRPDATWIDWFLAEFIRGAPIHDVLNLGCGEGALERELITRKFAGSYLGYELSAACVQRATETVSRDFPRARFVQADINHIELPRAAFDVVFFSHALHHIERLEHVLEQVRGALRPGGFLLLHEFVGPNRMQWTDTQLGVVNLLLEQLSPPLRVDLAGLPSVAPKAPVTRMSVAEWLRCDPSECVRSADILEVLPRCFEVLARRDFGGTVLQKLLENIVGNFDPANEDHSCIVRLLIAVEKILIEQGVLDSDFTFIVARPRMR